MMNDMMVNSIFKIFIFRFFRIIFRYWFHFLRKDFSRICHENKVFHAQTLYMFYFYLTTMARCKIRVYMNYGTSTQYYFLYHRANHQRRFFLNFLGYAFVTRLKYHHIILAYSIKYRNIHFGQKFPYL